MHTLIQVAEELLDKRYTIHKHTVACALRTTDGRVFTGLSMNSQKLHICAEWTAMGAAFLHGDGEIAMIVALHQKKSGEREFFPPCSLCRELFLTYCPNATVVLSEDQTITAKELLPFAWMRKYS